MADLGFVKGGGGGGSQMSMLGNSLTRFRESSYRIGKLVRGIPVLLRTKTAEEKRKRELEKFFFLKPFKRENFNSINLCKMQECIVF